ncbi:MAG: hypothetical protein A2019_06325 [Sulfurimonas sp. GWF2_37_8]|nr:MAG: hypothetical protein A2019_06325 [Sulfurimonas sp. GWF2_37_8]
MITVLLSTYNGSKYLKNQLDSLIAQSYKDFEIIARDDGSSDDTLMILKSYGIKLLESERNLGAKGSFGELLKYALRNSDTKYFMFCDQDDVWQSDKIEKTLTKMQYMENKYGDMPLLVHTDLEVVDEKLNTLAGSFWHYQNINPAQDRLNTLILQNIVTGCTMMINRKLAQMIEDVPVEAVMHDWWIAMVASAFGKIGYIKEPLMLYRQHSNNDTGAKNYGIEYFIKKFLQKQDFSKYTLQARKFFEVYGDKLDKPSQEMLEKFSHLEKMNWLEKRVFLVKHEILKNGIVRNIGLMVRV